MDKTKIFATVLIAIALIFTLRSGVNAPGVRKVDNQPSMIVESSEEGSLPEEAQPPSEPEQSVEEILPEKEVLLSEITPAEEIVEEMTADETYDEIIPDDTSLCCRLSVICDEIFQNMEKFDKEKVEIIPKDGIIFKEKTVAYTEGESVFDLLLREMKQNNIHIEFEKTPVYNSVYIEGIANIYEFDCGKLSGWRYKVNGQFPNIGCSQYKVKKGDIIEWVYTCSKGVSAEE